MDALLASPSRTAAFGAAAAAALLLLAWGAGTARADDLLIAVLRFVHVFAAAVWVGLIWFVNFVQLPAVAQADEAGRGVLHGVIVPRVAWWFRHMATLTVVSGLALLLAQGRLWATLTLNTHYGLSFKDPVLLLGLGVWGGIVMLGIVHGVLWPNIRIVLGLAGGDAEAKAAARAKVRRFARLNLILSLPVVLAMLAARGLA